MGGAAQPLVHSLLPPPGLRSRAVTRGRSTPLALSAVNGIGKARARRLIAAGV
jgi:hypothetical protein